MHGIFHTILKGKINVKFNYWLYCYNILYIISLNIISFNNMYHDGELNLSTGLAVYGTNSKSLLVSLLSFPTPFILTFSICNY